MNKRKPEKIIESRKARKYNKTGAGTTGNNRQFKRESVDQYADRILRDVNKLESEEDFLESGSDFLESESDY